MYTNKIIYKIITICKLGLKTTSLFLCYVDEKLSFMC